MIENNNIRHFYFEEDFIVKCEFPGGRPVYPWRMVFNTGSSSFYDYTASFDGQDYEHCYPMEDADSIVIEFKCHNLRCGRLSYTFERTLPNDLFSDGKQTRITPVLADIVLWDKPSDDDTQPETIAILERMLKGDPGPGVPSGGHPGQVLTKATDEDYDTAWRNPSSGGGITPEELDAVLDKATIRCDLPQSLSTEEQLRALENCGLVFVKFDNAENKTFISNEKAQRMRESAFVIVRNTSNGDMVLTRGERIDNYVYFYGFITNGFCNVASIRNDGYLNVYAAPFRSVELVSYVLDQRPDSARQKRARFNTSSVGYLCLAATMGAEADNWPLVVTSSLADVQAAFELFWANPGRYRWSLTINSDAEMNPFVEEAELEPLHRDDGGLELQFTSKKSGLRYAIVLTREEYVITEVRVEYRYHPYQKHYLTIPGVAFNHQTGLWSVNGSNMLTVDIDNMWPTLVR